MATLVSAKEAEQFMLCSLVTIQMIRFYSPSSLTLPVSAFCSLVSFRVSLASREFMLI
jgi:hypothetical protein